jgi:hypothetical protein
LTRIDEAIDGLNAVVLRIGSLDLQRQTKKINPSQQAKHNKSDLETVTSLRMVREHVSRSSTTSRKTSSRRIDIQSHLFY